MGYCLHHDKRVNCPHCIETDFGRINFYIFPNFMNTTPQAVTERYVSNLIHYGRNKEFDITSILRDVNQIEGRVVGVFFYASIIKVPIEPDNKQTGVGATISQAVRHALEKHGVTFR